MSTTQVRARPWIDAAAACLAWRPAITVERLALYAALFFSLTANTVFWREVIATGDLHGPRGLLSGLSLFALVTSLHAVLLLALLARRTAKPVLIVLLMTTASATWFMGRYTIYLDSDMMRNVLHTDAREASELLSPALWPWLLWYGALPALLLSRVRIVRRPMLRAIAVRLAWLSASAAIAAGSALLSFQDLAALMRNHHDLRHLVTPGNYLVALATVLAADGRASGPREPVGTDARGAPTMPGVRPRLLVLVVGETLRAQNWGLNGYRRQTTPELARLDPINFTDVTACGSSTEVSLPCMFSPYGRAHYDEARIARSESLLHVLDHAGIATQWRDNQSGCKGVCDGLPYLSFQRGKDGTGCAGESCLDEVMLDGLEEEIARHPGDLVLVLHQLGNHGPSYHKRYPARLERYVPACGSDDLGDCSREEIVNAYDNAVLYTDRFLAQAIRRLATQSSHDAALVYVSDHGESLGENGFYLHGMPYAIAPQTQLKVPMAVWLSPELARSRGIDAACLRRRAAQPASHDHLFHSVLGLLQVRTNAYVPALDLFAGCAPTETADAR